MAGIATFRNDSRTHPVTELPLREIYTTDGRMPMKLDARRLKKLASEATVRGITQPLQVCRTEKGYQLLRGFDLYYAAKLAGTSVVPCIVSEFDGESSSIASSDRLTASFFQEAESIERLISNYGMTQEDAAAHLGKAQSTVANKLRLLRLTEEERQIITDNHLTERHARALLRLGAPQERMLILNQIVKNSLNVEKTELAVEKLIGCTRKREPYRRRTRSVQNVRTFASSIKRAADSLETAGMHVDIERFQSAECIEFRIRVMGDS